MRKSSRGGVTAVVAKKKTTASSSFSQKRYHHRTPLGEINDEEDEQRVQEKDSPMTVRRKWNKEHGVFCGGNSPSSARFKATAMDKVLILNRRVDTLEAKLIDANEHIKEQDAYSNRLQKDLVEAQKVHKQLRVLERERRLADEEVANLDEKLASIRNETKEDIQRLTIENDRLRNKETRELEDLEEEVKNKTLHVEDLEQSLSRSQGREMLMSRERDVALIEAERGAKELAATQARCVALSKAHEEAVVSCSKLKVENERTKEENVKLSSEVEDLTEQIENKRKENDLLYSALEDKKLVVLDEARSIASNSSMKQRVDFKEALAKATHEAERKADEAERKLEAERKDVTELICSFEEELKSKTEKIASLRLELANARSKNASTSSSPSSMNVAAKKQQQRKQQSVLLNDPLDEEDEEDDGYYNYNEENAHHHQGGVKTEMQIRYEQAERKQEEYERSEELKRLDATRWTLQKELEKEIRDANALRDENKNISYAFDKLKREHEFTEEKLQAADLHLEMLEKTHRAAREALKSAEEEKFQAERAVRNAKTDAEMALKRKESAAISENRAMKMQVQSLERQLERCEERVKAAELDAANALVKVNEEVETRARLEVDVQAKENKMKIKERDLRNKLEHSRQALHFVVLAETKTLMKLYNAAEVTRETGVIDTSTRPRDVDEKLWSRIVDALASIDIRTEEL
ncbi:unnamed protein product [Bathycoccus prasinos]